MNKREVKFFVSYASKNNKAKAKFMDLFLEISAPDKHFEYRLWDDENLLVGENWHDQIQLAAKSCDFGLLLVSPAFFSSKYILESELTHFQAEKRCFPVMLAKIDFARHDIKGLQDTQIFRLIKQERNQVFIQRLQERKEAAVR